MSRVCDSCGWPKGSSIHSDHAPPDAKASQPHRYVASKRKTVKDMMRERQEDLAKLLALAESFDRAAEFWAGYAHEARLKRDAEEPTSRMHDVHEADARADQAASSSWTEAAKRLRALLEPPTDGKLSE